MYSSESCHTCTRYRYSPEMSSLGSLVLRLLLLAPVVSGLTRLPADVWRPRAAAHAAQQRDAAPNREGSFKLDLRSLSADGDDAPLVVVKPRRLAAQAT